MANLPGSNLGVARASIEVSLDSLRGVGQQIRSISQQIGRNLETGISAGVRRAQRSINELRGELTGLSVVSGLLSGLGLATAGNLQQVNIRLREVFGSIENANRAMQRFEQLGRRAGVSGQEVAQTFLRLGQFIDNDIERFEDLFGLIQRLAVVDPLQGTAGAMIALSEALSSGGANLQSLQQRFEISSGAIKSAGEEAGGTWIDGLDLILDRMGATSEAAEELGDTFNVALNNARVAAVQFLAAGFQPMLGALTNLLQRGTDFLTWARQTNPALANLTSGMLAFAAVAAPTLLILNQMVTSMRTLRALGLFSLAARGAALGQVGLGAGLGFAGGIGTVRAIGSRQGDEKLAGYTPSDFFRDLKQTIINLASGLMDMTTRFDRFITNLQISFAQGIGGMLQAMGAFVSGIATMMPGFLGRGMTATGETLERAGGTLMERVPQDLEAGFQERLGERRQNLLDLTAFLVPPTKAGAEDLESFEQRKAIEEQINQQIIAAKAAYAQNVQRIERQANQARLDATEQYERQRTQVIAQYEQTLARDAEDFARQRQRQNEQAARQIADIREDALRRETEQRSEHEKRISELTEDYQRNRERAQQDHRDRLLDAASRLDARAILEEQRRFQRQQEDTETNFQERLDDERQSFGARLQAQREADAERIQDIQENLAQQQELEDEDRAVRLQRMAEDHNQQLQELDRTHGERIQQINRQAIVERQVLNEAFAAQMKDLGEYNQAWLTLQAQRQEESLKLADEFWKDFQRQIVRETLSSVGRSGGEPVNPLAPAPAIPQQFHSGGLVRRSGMAMVLAGEIVANRNNAQLAAAMMQMGGGRGGGTTLNGGVNIQIFAQPGQDPESIADAVDRRMMDIFRRMGR